MNFGNDVSWNSNALLNWGNVRADVWLCCQVATARSSDVYAQFAEIP